MNRRTGMNEQDVTGQAQTLDRALGTSQEGTGQKHKTRLLHSSQPTWKAFDKSVHSFTTNTQQTRDRPAAQHHRGFCENPGNTGRENVYFSTSICITAPWERKESAHTRKHHLLQISWLHTQKISIYSVSSTVLGELDIHWGRFEIGPSELISDINFLGRTHTQKVGMFPDDINICISELYGSEKVGPHHVCGHHLIYWEPE